MNPAVLSMVTLSVVMLSGVDALQCYDCYYNKPESDNVVLKAFFSALDKISSDYCKLENPSDIYEINTKTCAPEAGKVNRCAVVNGKVTTRVLGTFSMVFNTISRKCVAVDETSPDYTLGCHTNPPPSGALKNVLDMISGLTHLEFEGQACYYDHKTSASGRSSVSIIFLLAVICIGLFFVLNI